ncbi:MAG TPA: hypothetical protein VLW85_20970 [Myxococcales bacterium]|nr:hypothetical protein [Myxococcales bacterium]
MPEWYAAARFRELTEAFARLSDRRWRRENLPRPRRRGTPGGLVSISMDVTCRPLSD